MVNIFVWHDVMTTDVKAAEDFYSKVVGWRCEDSGMPGQSYTLLYNGDVQVGGIMPVPEENKGMPPMWMGYIGVDDVDAHAQKVTAAGGKIWKGPQDIPGVGRFAVAADPHGAGFILFKGNANTPPPSVPMDTPKHFAWHELMAGNMEEAASWYASLFGWTKDEAYDMGGFTYQTMKTGGETSSVGMMTKMPDMPMPFWSYYVWAGDIDAVTECVKANGGKVVMGPHEVPGGAWIVNCTDPQGAFISFLGSRG